MDIYDYAMLMEKDGEQYYREIASHTSHTGMRNIINLLAEAEVRHYRTFQQMKNKETVPVAHLGYLSGIKTIFAEMREKKESIVNGAEVELYQKAQELEQKTRDFYREKAKEVDARQKEVFLKIANEEQAHYNIMENLIVMLSRPDNWLENPEWYHLEEY